MEPDSMWQLIIIFVLIGLSAIFSAAEAAFRSISSLRLIQSFEDGNQNLKKGVELMKSPEKLRGVLMVGDNIFNISAVIIATIYFVQHGMPVHPVIFLAAISLLLIILGEIIPKSIGSLYPEIMIHRLSPFVNLVALLLYPLVLLMVWITDIFLVLIGGNPDKSKPFITEEELMSYVNASHADGVLEVEEKKMIVNVVEFGDIEVSEIMTPRTDIVTAPIDADYDAIYQLFKEEQFSRIPIFEDNKDQIVGILNIKKLMFYEGNPEDYVVSEHMRQPFFTYESKKTADLFNEMRQSKHQMAIVLDEYGGTAGLVTLEDLIEEIVGEIADEFDDEPQEITELEANCYLILGSTHLGDVNDSLGLHLVSEDFDSLGGFIIGILGRLPESGEIVTFEHIEFEVQTVEKNRIEQIKLTIHEIEEPSDNETPDLEV